MPRLLSLLALAAFAFFVIGVAAALVKFTLGLLLAGGGMLAILVAAVWLLIRLSVFEANAQRT